MDDTNAASGSFILSEHTCQRLSLAQINLATNNFDEALVIGRGGFGDVYKSLTKFGLVNEVAIKKLKSTSSQGAHEFEAEVKLLSRLRHGNLVSLIGYCSEEKEMALAYEFMPNGTLEDHLHRGDSKLSWLQLLKICIGAARGLDYLHTGTSTQQGVIHRDVKTSNILLDSNFDAKISDFGLAKENPINRTLTHVSTLVKGTFGYMDPCYFYSGKLTRKSDVYAFGVVLFEALSGKKAVDPTLEESLADWARDHFKNGRISEIIDHRLIGQISKKCLKDYATLGVSCLHNKPKQRPTMAEVVVKLESVLLRERENLSSGVNDESLINKVRYFFTSKVDLMPATQAEESKLRVSGKNNEKSNNQNVRTFTYDELVIATNDFRYKELITDSYEDVNLHNYRGWLDEFSYDPSESGIGLAMYVTRRHIGTYELDYNPQEYNHPNLLKLLGYCLNKQELYYVFERTPHTSLDKLLFEEPGKGLLSWVARLKICIDAARGLDYLHTGISSQHGMIHRDVKSSNILLDSNFAAKISDFGLAKITPIDQTQTHQTTYMSISVVRAFGYMDPSYFYSGKLTRKSDVYAFGVVLFEVLSGKKAIDPTLGDKGDLADWAQEKIKGGRVQEIVESGLMGQISNKCLKEYTNIAVLCLHNQPHKRPTMAEVVVKLESILSRERERAGSGVDDGRLINKVKYLFTGKADLMPATQSERSKLGVSAQFSSKRSVGTFTHADLIRATNNFSEQELSTYSLETVYKGWVDNLTESGDSVAMYVRRRHIGTSELDFKPEEYNHPNLVKLLGYCCVQQYLFCVYKLVPDASLDELLYGESGTRSLYWVERLKIAVGAAEGLSFLHKKGHPAYGQFKTACILVDAEYNARLRDYEVDNLFVALGSYFFEMDAHYAAPEWFRYQADIKSDHSIVAGPHPAADYGVMSEIYTFGVVLLEILTGVKVFDDNRPKGKQNLVEWVTPLLRDEINLKKILDTQLLDNNLPPKGAYKLALLASKCLQSTQDERPSMEEILQVLRECYPEQCDS